MRYVILLFLLVQSLLGYSQLFFIGESRADIKSLLKKNKLEFEEYSRTDSTSGIAFYYEGGTQMTCVLDSNDIVIWQRLYPEGEPVNYFVKWFNKDFVIISDTEWRNYENGKIYKIELTYLPFEIAFFTIILSPDSE